MIHNTVLQNENLFKVTAAAAVNVYSVELSPKFEVFKMLLPYIILKSNIKHELPKILL